jgi:hypothetical protein
MKTAYILALLSFASACSPAKERRLSILLDKIDQAIVMPAKAKPLESYARYYALRPDGKIDIFMDGNVYSGPQPSTFGCSEITKNDGLKDVPCDMPAEPKAGERRWVSIQDMPGVSDGGCSIIYGVYSPSTDQIEELRCNGPV